VHKNQRGPWWPDLDETFGVKKLLRYGLVNRIEDERVTFEFERPFGSIAAGERMEFTVAGNENSRAFLPVEPNGASVIARDGRGRPALLEHQTGKGRMVLCTYPLEHMAAQSLGVNPEPSWRLYAALAEVAGVTPEVRVHDPRVIVGEMVHESGRRFVWFISQSDAPLAFRPILASGHLRSLAEGGPAKVTSELELPPFGVSVLERVI
jgi:hypothetical protein